MAARGKRRVYNSKHWKLARAEVMDKRPLCAECLKRGVETMGTDADHVVPLEQGGAPFAVSNIQALCRKCHQAKTAKENRNRAKLRRMAPRPVVDERGYPLRRA